MSIHQPDMDTDTGRDTWHTTTTQTATLTNSLLTHPVDPLTAQAPTNTAKTHPCTWAGCNRLFACPHNVQQHIREAHTLERPHKCLVCAASGIDHGFSRPYGLNRHMAQVHGVGERPTRKARRSKRTVEMRNAFGAAMAGGSGDGAAVGAQNFDFDVDVDFGFQDQVQEVTGGAGDDFTQTAALLTDANAQMDWSGKDVEMSDAQFQAGNVSSGSGSDSSFGFFCGVCDSSFAAQREVFAHMHAMHKTARSRFCSCHECKAMFLSRAEDAVNHEKLLRGGGFLVLGDGVFPQRVLAADAADIATGMSPFSHHTDNAAAAAAAIPNSLGFAAGTIDPQLLSISADGL
ncbi:hypothetical protein Q7P37_002023 [Cladosporium fusiforme]